MLTRILLAVLNGIITLIVLLIVVKVLEMVGLGAIAGIIVPFVWAIAVIVGILNFLEVLPNYWNRFIS